MAPPARPLALLLALALLPLAPLAAPAQGEQAVVVRGPDAGPAARAAGARVVDAAGAVATALAGPAAIAALQAHGFAVEPWAQRTGRGGFRFDPADGDGIVPAPLRSDLGTRSLVAFRGPVLPAWRDALARSATVYDYLPRDSFVVRGDRGALGSLPGVAFAGPYHAGYKLAPGLLGGPPRDLAVLTFPDEDVQQAALAIAATGAQVRGTGSVPGLEGIVRARADGAQAAAIAQLDGVAWLEPAAPASADNEHAAAIVQDGDPAVRGLNARGLDGSTQLVSICDTGVDTRGAGTTRRMAHAMFDDPAHPDVTFQQPNPLHRKVALYYAPVEGGVTHGDFEDGSGHGTHTAGTLAGDVAPWGGPDLHDGGAYAARLAVCDITAGGTFLVPDDASRMWQPAYDLGARINSNSWGSGTGFDYTDASRQEDAYVARHRDFLILRSAGNTGADGLRPEALAKDVLAVASSKNAGSGGSIEDVSTFSSTGPAGDGRLKPDITAPGECLWSAQRGTADGYVCLSGTSMATPTAAAGAALLRDAFAKGWFPGTSDPSAALLRAMFFASGHEMTGAGAHQGLYAPQLAGAPGGSYVVRGLARAPLAPAGTFPNPEQGWGRLNLSAVAQPGLWFRDEGDALRTGEARSFVVRVPGGQPLRVVLAWTDEPGAAGASPALVNDLDLTVTGPDGLSYPGNAWLQDQSLPAPLPDHVNNAEGVELPAAAPGDWAITVAAADVPGGAQAFALVATGGAQGVPS